MICSGPDFYPTPKALVNRMIGCLTEQSLYGKILEPSAGGGNIALALKDSIKLKRAHWKRDDPIDIDCIEIDPNLRSVLKGHDLRVVHDNFLYYYTFTQYHAIVMNPPFSDGDRHLIKAIEMMRRGGQIVCLLNAETIKNPYTEWRQALVERLDELEASIEYLHGAFLDAERKTDVEVALININIPRSLDASIVLPKLQTRLDYDYMREADQQIISSDTVAQFVNRYRFEARAGIALINEWRQLSPYMLSKIGDENCDPILHLTVKGEDKYSPGATVNSYITALRDKYWRALLADPSFTGVLTSDLRAKYMERIDTLKHYDFSEFNILSIRAEFGSQIVESVESAIIKLFDTLSHEYHYCDETKKNRHYFNGWRSNSAWKINKKVIIPQNALTSAYGGSYVLSYSNRALQDLLDIEKVFSYLEGFPLANSDTPKIIEEAFRSGQTKNIETRYFLLTFFKKGTTHIYFKDDALLKKFNLFGAQQKRWLPPTYGHSAFADLSTDEQQVVESFEGRTEYERAYAAGMCLVGRPALAGLLEAA